MNIGEVSEKSGVSAKMIRYYEDIGLVPAAQRTASGYRNYGEHDVHMLAFVRRARDLGFPIDRIRELIKLWTDKSRSSHEVKDIALAHIASLDADILKLTALRDVLRHLAERCHGDDRPDCPILDDLEHNSCHSQGAKRSTK